MFIHQGLISSLGHLTHYLCSWRKGRLLSQLQIDTEPDDLRSWQVLIFSQEERILSTQEAIISIQEIFFFFFKPQAKFFTVASLPAAAAHILPCKDQGSSAQVPDGIRQLRGLWSTRVTHAARSAAQVQNRSLPGGTGTWSTRCLLPPAPFPLPSAEQKHEKKEILLPTCWR